MLMECRIKQILQFNSKKTLKRVASTDSSPLSLLPPRVDIGPQDQNAFDFIYRLKRSERLFIHKSLLLSLGLGNLVYVLDKNLFDSRQDHVVSTKVVTVFM